MPILNDIKINVDPIKEWPMYAIRKTHSYILREFFMSSNYKICIENSQDYYEKNKFILNEIKKTNKSLGLDEEIFLANAKEISDWTLEMEKEDYNDLYIHSFIGMWSALETGIENIFKDFVKNDIISAKNIITKFKLGKYNINNWPWNDSTCYEIASNLEKRVRQLNSNKNLGVNYYERIKIVFSWFELEYNLNNEDIYYLNEANRVRNIILHRYGNIEEKDISDFPRLRQYKNRLIHINEELFNRYYSAIMNMLIEV